MQQQETPVLALRHHLVLSQHRQVCLVLQLISRRQLGLCLEVQRQCLGKTNSNSSSNQLQHSVSSIATCSNIA